MVIQRSHQLLRLLHDWPRHAPKGAVVRIAHATNPDAEPRTSMLAFRDALATRATYYLYEIGVIMFQELTNC